MKSLLFDSSALICFAMTCSCPLLPQLKKEYGGKFLIPNSVKKEVIDRPLEIPRFKYEGHRLKNMLDHNVLSIINENDYKAEIDSLGELANSTFSANGEDIKIMHFGELALLVLAKSLGADAVVIDERTTRLLVEAPEQIPALLGAKLHVRILTNQGRLKELRKRLAGINLLRSADLCTIAYMKKFIDGDKDTLNGLLWALKFAGCAISASEIEEYSKKFI